MKQLFRALLCVIGLFVPVSAKAQYTQVTATSVRIGGRTIANGMVCAVAVDGSDNPISVAVGGGGLVGVGQNCANIVAGAITTDIDAGGGNFLVPDEAVAGNSGFFYDFLISDTSTKNSFSLKKVPNVTGSIFVLDHYFPVITVPTVGSFTFTTGSGAPTGACAVKSFYEDIAIPSAPVLYQCGADLQFHLVSVGGGGGVGALLSANNLSDVANATTARANLGLGSAALVSTGSFDASGAATAAQTAAIASGVSTGVQKAANLSDLANAVTARTNLGLGTSAVTASSAYDAAGTATTAVAAIPQGSSSVFGLLKCGSGITCTAGVAAASGTAGVSSIDTLTGAFTFTGAGVSHTGNAYTFSGGGGSFTPPTGTGFFHITSGATDGAARAVDVSSADVTGVLAAARHPALTGDITSSAGALATTLATVNSNVGTCGDASHVGQVTLNAKGLTTACTPVAISAGGAVTTTLGDMTYGGTSGASTRLAGNTTAAKQFFSQTGTGSVSAAPAWSALSAADVTTALSTDTVNNSSYGYHTGSGGDSTCPTPAASVTYHCQKSSVEQVSVNGAAYVPAVNSVPTSTLTDSASVTWTIGSNPFANSVLTLIHTTSTRSLNLAGLVTGGNYVVVLKQDATGSALLTLGTGCTWKVSGGGAGAVTLSTAANSVDVLVFYYDGTNCYTNLNKNFN